jgi:hypothetical protein
MDEFDGVGGSYVLDPKTGKRVCKERTTMPDAEDKAPEPKETTKEADE